MCDTVGCDQEPTHVDLFDNLYCEDCMNYEIEEGLEDAESFDAL